MTLPQRQTPHQESRPERRPERRELRYPLHLPVVLRLAREEQHARSENISLGGILILSELPIPEGATVEVAVGVSHTHDPGILLSARGKVLRVQPNETGDFSVAIRLDGSFQLPFRRQYGQLRPAARKQPASDRAPIRPVFYRAPDLSAWHTET